MSMCHWIPPTMFRSGDQSYQGSRIDQTNPEGILILWILGVIDEFLYFLCSFIFDLPSEDRPERTARLT